MKKALLLIVAIGITQAGCVSAFKVSQHNRDYSRAVQARASNQSFELGFDILSIGDGYFGAWKQDPWGMSGATAADVVLGAVTVWAGKEGLDALKDGDSSDKPTSGAVAPTSGDGNMTINNSGTGNVYVEQEENSHNGE